MQSPVWGSEGRPRTPKLEGSNDCGLKADHDGKAVVLGRGRGGILPGAQRGWG